MFSPAAPSTSKEPASFASFESYLDPMMLLPADGTEYMNDLNDLPHDLNTDFFQQQQQQQQAPEIPQQIPSLNGSGNLYEQLISSPALSTTAQAPSSPMLMFPYSPAALAMGGSPSCLMTSNEPSWMHSTRTRRRRSSPPMQQYMMMSPMSPHVSPGMFTTSPPMQMAATHATPYYYPTGAPGAMPMNVTVKLPMAPLTPSNNPSQPKSSGQGVKVPLMLPSHFCNPSVAPNSAHDSPVSSRCSSVAPGSSISNSSSGWFSAMSATKDSFLEAVSCLDYSNVTVLEMKQLLRKFGLNSTGKKVQLIERIREIQTFLRQERIK